jgi:hypothetical protein
MHLCTPPPPMVWLKYFVSYTCTTSLSQSLHFRYFAGKVLFLNKIVGLKNDGPEKGYRGLLYALYPV